MKNPSEMTDGELRQELTREQPWGEYRAALREAVLRWVKSVPDDSSGPLAADEVGKGFGDV